mmetsp:Transcript_25878/g.54485  ORF Transcript_25878/g.54485 Transcript_25878/m.54485 type:complete len:244 (-) Transcript_25878:89-820(-)
MSNSINVTTSPTFDSNWGSFSLPTSKTGGLSEDQEGLLQQKDAKSSPLDFSPSTVFAVNDLNGVFRVSGETQQLTKGQKEIKNKPFRTPSFMTDDELSTFSEDDDDDDDDDMNKNSSTRLFSRRPQSIFRSSGIKRSYECLSDAEGSCSSPGVSRANPISCSEDSSEGIYSSPQRCISLSTSTKRPRHGRASCPSPLFVTDSLSYRLSCGGRGRMFSFSSEDLRHPLAFDPSVASSDVFSKSD